MGFLHFLIVLIVQTYVCYCVNIRLHINCLCIRVSLCTYRSEQIIALIKNLDRRDGFEENEHEHILPAGTRFLHRNSYIFAYVNID